MTLFRITTNSMLVQTFLLWVKMLSFSFLNVNFDRKKTSTTHLNIKKAQLIHFNNKLMVLQWDLTLISAKQICLGGGKTKINQQISDHHLFPHHCWVSWVSRSVIRKQCGQCMHSRCTAALQASTLAQTFIGPPAKCQVWQITSPALPFNHRSATGQVPGWT